MSAFSKEGVGPLRDEKYWIAKGFKIKIFVCMSILYSNYEVFLTRGKSLSISYAIGDIIFNWK